MNEIRLQLALAKAGLASRRHAEELIVAGRVAVNGRVVTQLGSRIDPVSDRVTVDGNPVLREAPAYYLMNKPKGYVTTAEDPEGRPTVFSLLKGGMVRLFSVGRLDYNTEGALLLTNDGELAHALMHPSRGVAKVYHAKFRGVVSREQLAMLRRGVDLPPARPLDRTGKPLPTAPGANRPERSAPAQVTTISSTGRHTWLQFILHEGKNRQIHRMAEAVGSSLLKLLRVEYAGLSLFDLPVGEYRPLQSAEVLELRQSVGLPAIAAQQGPTKPRARAQADSPPSPRGRGGSPRAPMSAADPDRPERFRSDPTPRRRTSDEMDRPPRRAAGSGMDRPPRRAAGSEMDRPPRRTASSEMNRPPRRTTSSEMDRPPRRAAGSEVDQPPRRSTPAAGRHSSSPWTGDRPMGRTGDRRKPEFRGRDAEPSPHGAAAPGPRRPPDHPGTMTEPRDGYKGPRPRRSPAPRPQPRELPHDWPPR